MLAQMPAGLLDKWISYYRLEPWGDDWERTSMLLSNILNMMVSMAPRGEGDEPPDPIPVDAFVPFRDRRSQEKRAIKAARKDLRRLRGIGDGG